jgi:PAT family beta-lactamase induction signal transducer AmpG
MKNDGSKRKATLHPGSWVSTTYFAEGYPYAVVHQLAEAIFKEMGASLQLIGLTSLFHLPWNLKFLWGPFLDRYATKRSWLVGIEIAITILLALLALSTTMSHILITTSILFFILAVFAATHDIAIDGYYLEALNTDDQSKFVGFRAMAFRVAVFVIAGPVFIIYGGWGWFPTLVLVALVMLVLTLFHLAFLPRVEKEERTFGELAKRIWTFKTLLIGATIALAIAGIKGIIGADAIQNAIASSPVVKTISPSGWIGLALLCALLVLLAFIPLFKNRLSTSRSYYAGTFVDFLDQPRIAIILAFVVFLRTGESFLLKMRYAFLREIGMTPAEFGWANSLAIWALIGATMVGGWLIANHGLKRWIWPFILAQNTLNLLYMGLAGRYEHLIGHPELGLPNMGLLTGVITLENIGSGFGTAVFMVYLMRCCKPGHKAAHYAILSALMSVSFTLSGVFSGFIADAWGFRNYFAFTFAATIPGMALIFFLPYLDGRSASDAG